MGRTRNKQPIELVSGLACVAVVSAALVYAPAAMAQSAAELDKKTPSIYASSTVEFAVDKSNTLGGTDFGSAIGLNAGLWTGKSRQIGMSIHRDIENTNFSQISGSTNTTWTDFILAYRFYWFRPHVSLGFCSIKIVQAGTTLMDSLCATTGGGLDILVPAGAYIVTYGKFDLTKPALVKDQTGSVNNISTRTDYDIGVSIRPKFEWLEVLVGYHYRTFGLDINGTSNTEVQTGPYTGIQFGMIL